MAETEDPLLARGWLSHLPRRLALEVLALGMERLYPDGAAAYRQGDQADGLYGVREGRMRLVSYAADGARHLMHVARPGGWFGEMATLDTRPRQQDAIASGPARVLHVPLGRFEVLAIVQPTLWRAVGQLATRRQRAALAYMETLRLCGPRRRIAAALAGHAGAGGGGLEVTQAELAESVGASRQTVNRVLAGFRSAGLVKVAYGRVLVIDSEALRAIE